ncbi:hypothetical protein AMS58_19330 [Pseudoalteromonas porphyrae]|uniref:Uncharacterized protein n=2 Tax=Pseudoalteromonas TaxID=53246 RepID=A0A0N1EN14_9GAMM|nr:MULTISPECIES: hypothetical protein [Pseudoalteromonas]KPH65083.1 hypothetical protein ADS77_02065 [Pseudoalteromonas porphyrae]KPH93082.1 hypothetical protein AMS58_19330 [Pseudoalteromonas porphyrae]NNG44175.1 hypothetical protein [Pseudoalteromonas sp. NEC-BIFX-2020_002]
MIIDYFIQKPNRKVTHLSQKMDALDGLKKQHQQAFNYRLKRFLVSNVGIGSAFTAGAGYQALKSSEKHKSTASKISKLTWLLRLL